VNNADESAGKGNHFPLCVRCVRCSDTHYRSYLIAIYTYISIIILTAYCLWFWSTVEHDQDDQTQIVNKYQYIYTHFSYVQLSNCTYICSFYGNTSRWFRRAVSETISYKGWFKSPFAHVRGSVGSGKWLKSPYICVTHKSHDTHTACVCTEPFESPCTCIARWTTSRPAVEFNNLPV
jgi:hypothetical protein